MVHGACENGNASGVAQSAVRAELARIAGRFEAADRRAKAADAAADREAAEAERQDAAGEFWAAGEDLAQLLLLLLRYAVRNQPEALTALLAEALRPELRPILEAVARLEARRP